MLLPEELHTLDAALARVLPVEDPDAMRAYVLARAAIQPDLYRAGVLVLQTRGFDDAPPEAQDAILSGLENHPSIALLIQHAVEGFYTSPAGLAEVGFRVTA